MNHRIRFLLYSIISVSFMVSSSSQALELALESQGDYLVGDTISVDIVVDSATSLYGLALDLSYDNTVLTVPDSDGVAQGVQPEISEGTALTSDGESTFLRSALVDNKQGRLVLGNVRSGQVTGIDLSGRHTVMTVTFQALRPGTVDISYRPESTIINGADLRKLLIDALVSATINISTIPGDIAGSGTIDLMDVILALQVLSGENLGANEVYVSADVNGDNRIGIEEALFDMNHIVNNP